MTLQTNISERPPNKISKSLEADAPAERGDWRLGFASLETEATVGRELDVVGTLPPDLQGTLYRIGPARNDVYGDRYRHWFDGDGMVHALQLEGGRVVYKNRFVATAGKAREDAARRRIFSTFGSPPAGDMLTRLANRKAKNSANTNIVAHAGKLRALFEGGRPHAIDPETLATLGEDDMSGELGSSDTYSAHPKLDPATGAMWNFGVGFGRRAMVRLYCTRPDGTTTRAAEFALPFGAFVHDFAITETKAVFVVPPLTLAAVPFALLLGQHSFADGLRWRPELGTRIAVVDRASGEVRWHRTDALMLFHTIQAWEEAGDIVVDLCAYPDDTVMRSFREVMRQVSVPTPAPAWPERLGLRGDGTVTRTRLSKTSLEFPRTAGRAPAGGYTRVYGVSWSEGVEFLGVPTAIDVKTGRAEVAPRAPGELSGECVPVMKAGATSEREAWLLAIVLDAVRGVSELRILDAGDLAAPPVARVALPYVMPFGFHGNWLRRAAV